MAHGAIGIEPHGFFECAQRLVVPETMNQREPLIEPLLGLRRFCRDRDVRLADAVDSQGRGKFGEVDMLVFRRAVLVRLGGGDQTAE
jgi:hypothetical protein